MCCRICEGGQERRGPDVRVDSERLGQLCLGIEPFDTGLGCEFMQPEVRASRVLRHRTDQVGVRPVEPLGLSRPFLELYGGGEAQQGVRVGGVGQIGRRKPPGRERQCALLPQAHRELRLRFTEPSRSQKRDRQRLARKGVRGLKTHRGAEVGESRAHLGPLEARDTSCEKRFH